MLRLKSRKLEVIHPGSIEPFVKIPIIFCNCVKWWNKRTQDHIIMTINNSLTFHKCVIKFEQYIMLPLSKPDGTTNVNLTQQNLR